MRLLMFLQSHYLNQLVDSKRRATVLSFRGLAVNVSYGLMSVAFACAVRAVEQTTSSVDQGLAFDRIVQLLPGYFLFIVAGFVIWARRATDGDSRVTIRDGFAVTAASSNDTHKSSLPSE